MYRYHLRLIFSYRAPTFRFPMFTINFTFCSSFPCYDECVDMMGDKVVQWKKLFVVYKQPADWRYWTLCMIQTNMKWDFIDFIAILNRCYLWMGSTCGWFMLPKKIALFSLYIFIESLYVPVFVLIIWFTLLVFLFSPFSICISSSRWKSGSNAC